jgi:hypothetical protein
MAWDIIYYRAADGTVPAEIFLDDCPTSVEANLIAVLDAVAEAPPPAYSGGGKWEAMRGDMGGYFEAKATGPAREHFRLFCLLENGSPDELRRRGLRGPTLAVITGLRKPFRTIISDRDYARVRTLGDNHQSNYPRHIA